MLPLFLVLASFIYAPAMLRVGSSRHLHRKSAALLTAEAALATTVAKIKENASYGRDPAASPPIEVVYPEMESRAVVFFAAPAQALAQQFRTADGGLEEADRSVNCFGEENSVALPGESQLRVYPGQIHLTAVARCQTTLVRKQVRLTLPPFPFAIASSGTFSTSGSLLLGAIKPGLDIHGSWTEEDLLPAEVVANGSVANALLLKGDALIVGNATTPGTAEVDPGVKFLRGGQAHTGAKPEALPVVDIQSYDPSARTGVQTLSDPAFPELKAVEGICRRQGDVSFAKGLRLNGLLYVDGDVEIAAGGIPGSGALVCTGKVTIRGGSDFVADSRCAVVAGGDVVLSGTGQTSSYYQGLLYSAGSGGIEVSGVTLLGAAVASAESGAKVQVRDSRLVYDAKATRVTSEIAFPADAYPPGGIEARDLGGALIGFLKLNPQPMPGPPPRTADPPTPADFVTLGITKLSADHFHLVDAQGKALGGDPGPAFNGAYHRYIRHMDDVITAVQSPDPMLSNGKFDFDLNRFVKVADRLRILWRN